MPTVRPHAAGLVVIVLGLLSGALMIWLGGWRQPSEHLPPPAVVRAMLGVGWLVVQVVWFGSAYFVSTRGFAALSAIATTLGILGMAFGRGGFGALTGAFLLVGPLVLLSTAAGFWLDFRRSAVTGAHRPWRLFVWLTLVGVVYLYAALISGAEAQVTAMALTLAVCGAAALCWPLMASIATSVLVMPTTRLSKWAWSGAMILLVINGWIAQRNGLSTPQIAVGSLSLAPYFLAGGLVVLAAALECESARENPIASAIRIVLGLVASAFIYMAMMHEAGTLAAVLVGVLAVMVIAAPPSLAIAAIVTLFTGQLILQNETVIQTIRPLAPRVGDRLLIWSNHLQPVNQMLRVQEAARLSGATGHMGAAKMQFLVGPQLSSDYMPTQIMVQGGWLGFILVMLVTILLAAELYREARAARTPVARAIQNSVLALLLGNLLVTTLWLGDVTPFVGVPLPVVARAGSHLLVLALLLLAFDVTSQVDRAAQPLRT